LELCFDIEKLLQWSGGEFLKVAASMKILAMPSIATKEREVVAPAAPSCLHVQVVKHHHDETSLHIDSNTIPAASTSLSLQNSFCEPMSSKSAAGFGHRSINRPCRHAFGREM
jgi:hypothetical protein